MLSLHSYRSIAREYLTVLHSALLLIYTASFLRSEPSKSKYMPLNADSEQYPKHAAQHICTSLAEHLSQIPVVLLYRTQEEMSRCETSLHAYYPLNLQPKHIWSKMQRNPEQGLTDDGLGVSKEYPMQNEAKYERLRVVCRDEGVSVIAGQGTQGFLRQAHGGQRYSVLLTLVSSMYARWMPFRENIRHRTKQQT